MPYINIHMAKGRTTEQKRALVKGITDAVVNNLGVTPDRVMIEIFDITPDNTAMGGKLFIDVQKSS